MRYALLLFTICALLTALIGSALFFEWYHAERIYPGVFVWEAALGGLTRAEAATRLADGFGLDAHAVKLYAPDRSWSVRPTDLGLRLDLEATLVAAYARGREAAVPWPERLRTHFRLLLRPETFPPVVVYDEGMARMYLQALARQIDLPAADATITLDGLTPVVTPARAGRYLDVEATLPAVSQAVTRTGPPDVRLVVREILPAVADAEPARAEAERILSAPLTLMLEQPREGDPGPWTLPPEQLVTMLMVQEESGALHVRLDAEPLRYYLAGLAPELAIAPVDARFHFNDALRQLEPISRSVTGRALDIEASAARIVQEMGAGNHFVPLVLQPVPPRYPDDATAEQLGIVELVAEGDSYFIGSPSGRDRNIRLAASKFDGLVIGPGETFSFNQYLGEVSAAAGYDEAYVITGEQLAIEVGGGICQVSTTAFRAAFWGGYPIVERWYHNHRVGYYEQMGAGVGMDSTVYSPLVDFKFTNDRPYPLLMETAIEGAHRLVFRFYSTGDGRRVEKGGPVISDETTPGPPIYQLDESMAEGTVKQWQTALNGLTATITRKVYDAAGNLLYNDAFVSKYAARRAIYRHGPGYQPPAEGEATPTPTPSP